MMAGLLVLFSFLLFSPLPVQAYILDYHLILSKTAENHGRGPYIIEQDVVFRADPDPLIVHETWWMIHEQSMRLQVEGQGSLKGLIQGTVIYEAAKKYRWEDQTLRSFRLSEDWLEPFFHFRFSKNMKSHLIALKIAPSESLKERASVVVSTKGVDAKYQPQPFVRLARTGGSMSYAIGSPSLPEKTTQPPGLWIEQDQFVVRKIRFPSQAVVTTDSYMKQPEGLWLPKTRYVNWASNAVQIHLKSVRSLGKKDPQLLLLKPQSLVNSSGASSFKWPDQEVVREFYQRFR